MELKKNLFMEFEVKFIYGILSKIYLWNLKKHLFMEFKVTFIYGI